MKKSKKELINIVKSGLEEIRKDTKLKENAKKELEKFGVSSGEVSSYLTNPDRVEDLDIRLLGLLLEQAQKNTGEIRFEIDKFFTKNEITEMKQYHHVTDDDSIHFPLELDNVSIVGDGVYISVISSKTIAKLMKARALFYNFDIQRQAKKVKREDGIIKKATIYKKNVKEIKNEILKGQLFDTTIAFNAALGSSETGEELTYDSKKRTITINEGTRLDILDGMHRCLGSQEAYESDKEINTFFTLRLSNHTTRQCQLYQAQLAKATPIPKTRVQELQANRLADTVTQMLKTDSELKDRISSTHRINTSVGEVVSYNTLADAIEENFKMETRVDAAEVGEYLSKFFDYLFDYIVKNKEDNENSLILYNKMFVGYIVLAKRMKEENIKLTKVREIMNEINFDRNDELWKNIVNDGKLTTNAEKEIKNIFKKIKL